MCALSSVSSKLVISVRGLNEAKKEILKYHELLTGTYRYIPAFSVLVPGTVQHHIHTYMVRTDRRTTRNEILSK